MKRLRKEWLVAAEKMQAVISSRELSLAKLKTEKKAPFIIKKINDEIDIMYDFFNQANETFQAYELESLNLSIKLMLLKGEQEALKDMIMHLEAEPGKELEFMEKLMKGGKLKNL